MTVQLLHFIDKRLWGKVTWLESYSDLVNTRARLGIQPSWLLTQCCFLPHQTASRVGESSGRGAAAGREADFYPHLWLFPFSLVNSPLQPPAAWLCDYCREKVVSQGLCREQHHQSWHVHLSKKCLLGRTLLPVATISNLLQKVTSRSLFCFFFFGPVFQYIKCNYFIVDLLVITGMCLNMIYWVSFVPVDLQ